MLQLPRFLRNRQAGGQCKLGPLGNWRRTLPVTAFRASLGRLRHDSGNSRPMAGRRRYRLGLAEESGTRFGEHRERESKIVRIGLNSHQFAQNGAKAHRVGNAAVAHLAIVRRAFHNLRLRLRLQEDDFGAVDSVRLNVGQVHVLLNVGNSHHVPVGGAPNLNAGVPPVARGESLGAQRTRLWTIEAELVALILTGGVKIAMHEEIVASQQGGQPRRALATGEFPSHDHCRGDRRNVTRKARNWRSELSNASYHKHRAMRKDAATLNL